MSWIWGTSKRAAPPTPSGVQMSASSSLISSLRSFLALRYRSLWLCAAIIGVMIGFGAAFARNTIGWLPVIGSCLATIAIFTMSGVPFRLVLLCSTLLWLTNNIVSRSIGGILLELANATVNLSTIVRMLRSSTAAAATSPEQPASQFSVKG